VDGFSSSCKGPHGPFSTTGKMFVWRVRGLAWGFNAGDRAFWFHPRTYISVSRYGLTRLERHLCCAAADKGVTRLMCYTLQTPVITPKPWRATARGLTVHVFERSTCALLESPDERRRIERQFSRLMRCRSNRCSSALANSDMEAPSPPATGRICANMFFTGAGITGLCSFRNGGIANFRRTAACQ